MGPKRYDEKFESAFAGGMADQGVGDNGLIPDDGLVEFAARFAGLVMGRAKYRGIPGERAGKLAADICRPLYEMRVTA